MQIKHRHFEIARVDNPDIPNGKILSIIHEFCDFDKTYETDSAALRE